MSYNSYSQISALNGNHGIYPPAKPVYLGSGMWGPKPGEIVIWDANTNTSLAKEDIGDPKYPNIRIGWGVGMYTSDCVMTMGSGDYNICQDGIEVNFTKPCCGQAQEVDIILGCIECDKPYGIEIEMRNPWTKMYYGGEGDTVFTYEVATRCQPDCGEECDPSVDCFCLAQDLANKINEGRGKVEIDGYKIELDNDDAYYQPFWAVAIESGCKVWHACLSFTEQGDCCETCAYLPGLTELSIPVKGLDEPCVFDLSMFATSDGKTYPAQITAMQKYVNATLHKYGVHLQISKGLGKCCQYKMTLAGCVAAEPTLSGAGDPAFACEDPFTENDYKKACAGCNGSPGKRKPCSKVRIFMDPIELKCKCNLPADSFEYDTLENKITKISFTDDFRGKDGNGSWKQGYFGWEEVVEQVEPEGYGYEYFKAREEFQHWGGQGGFRYYGGHAIGKYGNVYMPGFQHDGVFGGIKCDETYCAMNICLTHYGWRDHVNATQHRNIQYVRLLIPMTSTVTHDAWLEIFECLGALGKCNVIGKGCLEDEGEPCSCTNCEDQVEAQVNPPEAVVGPHVPSLPGGETAEEGETKDAVAPTAAQKKATKALANASKATLKAKDAVVKSEGMIAVLKKDMKAEKNKKTKARINSSIATESKKLAALKAKVKAAQKTEKDRESALKAVTKEAAKAV